MRPTVTQYCEVVMGMTCILGQYLGSTTLAGAVAYGIATVLWWVWMLHGKHWGFLPLNLVGAWVSSVNLWSIA